MSIKQPGMSLDQAVAHGREWVAAGWTWAPGQVALVQVGGSTLRVVVGHIQAADSRIAPGWPQDYMTLDVVGKTSLDLGEWVPDMSNLGTSGHALDQVREAWGEVDIKIFILSDGRAVIIVRSEDGDELWETWDADSYADALLAARRAAP